MTTPLHMVELRDVEMQFEDKKVLDGVSLKVEPQQRLENPQVRRGAYRQKFGDAFNDSEQE